ncbi:MAG: ankyrin repeat domain-containing protein, partial [Caulobacterales bacterium]
VGRGPPAPAPISAFWGGRGFWFPPAPRLRAAAAAGRTTEMDALLEQGAPVDTPDAEGNTALIKSIQADHPAAAALLRRHGASLDRKNSAGESARDIATAKGDAELNQAIGLGP